MRTAPRVPAELLKQQQARGKMHVWPVHVCTRLNQTSSCSRSRGSAGFALFSNHLGVKPLLLTFIFNAIFIFMGFYLGAKQRFGRHLEPARPPAVDRCCLCTFPCAILFIFSKILIGFNQDLPVCV